MFVIGFLAITSIVLLINNLSGKKEVEVKSDYYASFVSSVQSLDRTLAQTNETKDNEEIVQKMFDVYTSIIFVNDRLALLKENTTGFPDIDFLINDFMLFRDSYASVIRHQLGVRDNINYKVNLRVLDQIKLFVNDLPKEYENSKEFSNQVGVAAKHIKPLLNISFE